MKTVMLTGFEPFGGEKINPAYEVIKELAHEEIPNVRIVTVKLPVVFGKVIEEFKKTVQKDKPNLILSLGQAGGREAISLEKIGININNATIPDNEGNKPIEELIFPNGPVAYFTTINNQKTVEKIIEENIPALISYSASTYVCNNLIYGALNYLSSEKELSKIKYGFIHVPYLPSQVALKTKLAPSMSLDLIKKAIKIAIIANI